MAEPDTGVKQPNRLIDETSPYLLQHAHNPVDWHPWGPGAFAEARERQVPIFLSIGYSTCYWCHVMERECFENEAIAQQLNEHFVCIKVDREERPDVDDIYMAALQALTQSGGWPLNAWLTPPGAEGADDPGLKPFFAGTYFPPEAKLGRTPFPNVLENINEAWNTNRAGVIEQANRVTEAVRDRFAEAMTPVRVDERHVGKAIEQLLTIHDREHGGFGGAPKFPQPVFLDFLIDTRGMLQDPAVRSTVDRAIRTTLDGMALGGMYDQVGGGFHRYSVDARWVVPHFEKMLYDQAQLASVYAKSFLFDRDPLDLRIMRETLSYVRREMTDETGMFFSAQDAEVNQREGQNYLWTPDQLTEVLGADDAAFAADVYGVREDGNFTDPHHPEDGPKTVLVLRARPDELAQARGITREELLQRIDAIDAKLLAARNTRDQPGLDDKVLTGWNGLMIAAFAQAALATGDIAYLDDAERASRAILEHMRPRDGVLLRVYRDGEAKQPAFLEDYAFLIHGLLTTHRVNAASGRADLRYLNAATELMDEAFALFGDDETGALHDTRAEQTDLIVRTASAYDGAIPAGVSVMLHNLIELHDIASELRHLQRAEALMRALSPEVRRSPVAAVNSTRALARLMALDQKLPERLGPDRDPREEPSHQAPVQILSATDRVVVPASGEASVMIRVVIDEDHHITAREPGHAGVRPFGVRLSGNDGVAIAGVDYPEGESYDGAALGADESMRVYTGTFDLTIRLRRTDQPWAGRAILFLDYQACTEEACLAPVTVELDLAIDAGE